MAVSFESPEYTAEVTAPSDKPAHVAAFAVFTALLAIALQAKPPQPGARWALRPGAALAVAALLAGAVGVGDELRQATQPGRVASWADLMARRRDSSLRAKRGNPLVSLRAAHANQNI